MENNKTLISKIGTAILALVIACFLVNSCESRKKADEHYRDEKARILREAQQPLTKEEQWKYNHKK